MGSASLQHLSHELSRLWFCDDIGPAQILGVCASTLLLVSGILIYQEAGPASAV